MGEKTIIKPIAYAVKPRVGVGGRLALPGPVCTCDAFASCEFVCWQVWRERIPAW